MADTGEATQGGGISPTLAMLQSATVMLRRSGDREAAAVVVRAFVELTLLSYQRSRRPALRLIRGGPAGPKTPRTTP